MTNVNDNVREYLEISLEEAEKALKLNNYPIGAVLIGQDGKILAKGHNEHVTSNDVTAHAEIICLRKAGVKLIDKRISTPSYLFTSLEPCYGCSFFIDRTNIKKIYWAQNDPHKGGISSLMNQKMFKSFFKDLEVTKEPFDDLKRKSGELMKKYFLANGRIDTAALYDI